VDDRPKTDAVMLLGIGHTVRGDCAWKGSGKGRKQKI
jgi:hypothetical protein